MPRVSVDFTDVEGFDVVPESSPRAVIEAVTRGTSQRSGEPMLTWEYKITEGKYKNVMIMDFTSLQKQALFRLKQRLQALGYEVPDGPLTFDSDDLVGLPVRLQIGPPRKDNQDNMRTNLIAVALAEGEAAEVETEEAPTEPEVRRPKKRPGVEESEEPAPFEKRRPSAVSPDSEPAVAKPRKALKLERL